MRAAGAVPATIAVVAGEARIGLDEAALEAIAGEGRGQVRRARPGGGGRARRSRGDHRGGHGAPGRARGHLGVRHRRARRRAPRGARDVGRVGRPGDAGARGHRGGVLGGQVDPRRRRDARAARDARRDRARLRHRPLPGLLPARLGLPGAVAGGHAGRGGGGAGGAARARDRRRARWSWRTRCRWRSSSIPTLHDRVLVGGAGRRRRGGRERQGDHPVPARLLPPRDAAAQASTPTCGLSMRNARLAARDRGGAPA